MEYQSMTDSRCAIWIFYILNQSSINGYLGCFHILAIVNRAAMNTRVHVSFSISFLFSNYIPRTETAGSYGSLTLVFWVTIVLFTTVAALICIPFNNVWGFLFVYFLSNICYFYTFWWQSFWQVWRFETSLWIWFAFL